MILREILAVFGLAFDDAGAKKADKSIGGLLNGVETLASAVAGSLLVEGLHRIVEAAADAEETMGKINHLFEEDADTVTSWAAQASDSLGQSEFALQRFASQLGMTVGPLVGSTKAAAEMSTTLAGLAIDLAAFAKISDEEAVATLQGALTGRAGELRKVGVVMNDAALQEFAYSQGIRQNVSDMTEAALTTLRYQFILAKTSKIQGEAARSMGDYDQQVKRLRGAWEDIVTKAGQSVLPAIESIVGVAADALRAFERFTEGTNLLQAGLIVLGIVAGALLIPLLPLLFTALKIGAALAVAALILDDFMIFLQGGQSALEDGLNLISEALTGSTDAASALLAIIFTVAEVIGKLGDVAGAVFMALGGDLSGFQLLWEDLVVFITRTGGVLKEILVGMWEAFKSAAADALTWVASKIKTALPDFLVRGFEAASNFVGSGAAGGAARAVGSAIAAPFGGGGVMQQTNEVALTLNVTGSAGDDPEALAGIIDERVNSILDDQYEAAGGALLPAVP